MSFYILCRKIISKLFILIFCTLLCLFKHNESRKKINKICLLLSNFLTFERGFEFLKWNLFISRAYGKNMFFQANCGKKPRILNSIPCRDLAEKLAEKIATELHAELIRICSTGQIRSKIYTTTKNIGLVFVCFCLFCF